MNFFLLVGLLVILSTFSCAEVSNEFKCLTLDRLPADMLHQIGFYLDHEFWRLEIVNKQLYNSFSTFPVKRIFQRLLDIPELVTDDVAEHEKELNYLLPLCKFSDPEHIYQALRTELYYGDKINTLVPHLSKYMRRSNEVSWHGHGQIKLITQRANYGHLFKNDSLIFMILKSYIFYDTKNMLNFQKFIQKHPQYMKHVLYFINSDEIKESINGIFLLSRWVVIALTNHMPDMFFDGYSEYLLKVFGSYNEFWTELFIPRERYPELFSRIHFIIDFLCIKDKRTRAFFELLNLIRFGPEDPNIYAKKIKPMRYSTDKLTLLCHCASLANKMDLFDKLYPLIVMDIKCNPSEIYLCHARQSEREQNNEIDSPFEAHKFAIDVHERAGKRFRQILYQNTVPCIVRILTKYCHVVSIDWGHNIYSIEFRTPIKDPLKSGIPQYISINKIFDSEFQQQFTLNLFLLYLKFETSLVFEQFMMRYLIQFKDNEKFPINGDNLKRLINSEALYQFVNENFPECRLNFEIKYKELVNVIDEPVPQYAANYKITCSHIGTLAEFKSAEQLKRIEELFGCSVIELVKVSKFSSPQIYFFHRHIFKYLAQSGQNLPDSLKKDILSIAEIDFPSFKKKM